MLWLALVLLTVVALSGILLPLLRQARPVPSGEHDAAFYREQMAAIDRDVLAGLVSVEDAQRARLEAARRILAIPAEPASARQPSRNGARVVACLVAIAVPALAFGLYWRIGSPELPDAPLEARLQTPNPGIDTLVARLEAHIAAHPDDGRAQELIAPVYLRMERLGDAVRAYENTLKLLGESPVRRAAYAEALVTEAGGDVTPAAIASFETALAADPALAKARFYLGAAAEQAGEKEKAAAVWRKMLDEGPPDAPWMGAVRERLATLGAGRPPIPSQAGSIAALPAGERDGVIRSMVEGLAARLAQNGDDAEGWLRLMRSLSVLQERERAKTALADARKALVADPAALQRIDAMARELGLGG